MTQDAIPLVSAAARAAVSYLAMRDLVFRQRVRGWQDPQSKRWYVDPSDLQRYISERADKIAVAVGGNS
jgi:hypothetical protein